MLDLVSVGEKSRKLCRHFESGARLFMSLKGRVGSGRVGLWLCNMCHTIQNIESSTLKIKISDFECKISYGVC